MNTCAPVVYACSPRPGGNTDCAVHCLCRGAAEAGEKIIPVFIRKSPVAPCCSCYACATPPHECFLDRNETFTGNMKTLTTPLLTAPILFFVSPIFFYHFPAQFKAFMDRTQRFYIMKQHNAPQMTSLIPRVAYTVLIAARKQGPKLFEGSLLSLKLMLDTFNITLATPLLLYGLDGPMELSRATDLQARIINYARKAFSLTDKL